MSMDIRNLVQKLGGPAVVAHEIGVTTKRVSMWGSRNRISAEYLVPMWRIALRKKVRWAPPGAEGFDLIELRRQDTRQLALFSDTADKGQAA